MGIFDFFTRKHETSIEDEGPSPDYVFAHYALRQIALSDPLRFLAIAASPDSHNFIEAVIQDITEQLGKPTAFEASQVKIHPVRVKEFPCVVIELPNPQKMADAHMVALVALVDLAFDLPSDSESVCGRYFTLEKGFTISNEDRTVLAEWDDTGHLNYGDGPAATVEAFVGAIEDRISNSMGE